MLMYALDEHLRMKMQTATSLALDRSIDCIDSAEYAAFRRRAAPERILAALTGNITVWALGAEPNAE